MKIGELPEMTFYILFICIILGFAFGLMSNISQGLEITKTYDVITHLQTGALYARCGQTYYVSLPLKWGEYVDGNTYYANILSFSNNPNIESNYITNTINLTYVDDSQINISTNLSSDLFYGDTIAPIRETQPSRYSLGYDIPTAIINSMAEGSQKNDTILLFLQGWFGGSSGLDMVSETGIETLPVYAMAYGKFTPIDGKHISLNSLGYLMTGKIDNEFKYIGNSSDLDSQYTTIIDQIIGTNPSNIYVTPLIWYNTNVIDYKRG